MDWLQYHQDELKKELRNHYGRTKFIQRQCIECQEREIRKITEQRAIEQLQNLTNQSGTS